MNKIFYALFIITFSGLFNFIAAQSCGYSGSTICNATGGPAGGGFENPDSVPCIIQGVPYDTTIQFTMFNAFTPPGYMTPFVVDSIRFLSIENLPCGLCWSTNNDSDLFAANEYGCIRIRGTSNDSSGQYKLSLTLKAWISGNSTGLSVPPSEVDMSGIRMYVRLQTASGSCNPVDTSSSFVGLTANPSRCATGLDDLNATVPYFSIFPNPTNSSTTVSFISTKDVRYTLNISDITGRLMATQEIEATPGTNNAIIQRDNKAAGVYLVSLNDGHNSITKRLSIME